MTAAAMTTMTLVAPGAQRRRQGLAGRRSGGGVYALKPIGRSPAYFKKPEEKPKGRNPVVNLFGNGEAKARIAQLEYELETGA